MRFRTFTTVKSNFLKIDLKWKPWGFVLAHPMVQYRLRVPCCLSSQYKIVAQITASSLSRQYQTGVYHTCCLSWSLSFRHSVIAYTDRQSANKTTLGQDPQGFINRSGLLHGVRHVACVQCRNKSGPTRTGLIKRLVLLNEVRHEACIQCRNKSGMRRDGHKKRLV